MNKRDFLKQSGTIVSGSLLSRLFAATSTAAHPRTNWSGNYTYSTDRLHSPKTLAELQSIVKSCDKMRVLGTRHSFNGIADSTENQISLKQFDQMAINAKARTVTVDSAVPYGRLATYLTSNGFALHNLASLPHISVAGACATATHGSGSKNGNLSTSVTALELVTASGDLATLSREHDGDRFLGAVVNLGGLGVVTKVTLAIEPTYNISQAVYQNLSFDQLKTHLDEIFQSGYSVSLFIDWQNHRATQVWLKRKVEGMSAAKLSAQFFGATLATRNLHPLEDHSAENCTEQMGIPGPWQERLPHFRMNFTPSSGAELQTEYFVPRDKAYQAVLAVEQIRDHITPHLFISEFRTIDADDLWMSPCHQRSSMAIHFTWKPDWPAVKKVLPLIEAQLAPFDARPHWAKLFTMAPTLLQSHYEKLPAFKELLSQYDPKGKFRNSFLNTNLYST